MGSSVIHIDSDLHERAKAYCKARNISLKTWVGDLLRNALGGTGVVGEVTPAIKSKPKTIYKPTDPELWTKPPFWAGRSGK